MATTINQVKKRIAQINSVAIIERDNSDTNPKEVVSLLKAISAANLDLAHEAVEYRGANSIFPYAADIISANANVTVTTREFPPDLMSVIMRTTASENAAEASGDTGTIVDVTGSTWSSSTTGIASHALIAGSALVEGTWILKAVDGTTFNVYAYHDADNLELAIDEEAKVNSTVYTLPTATTVDITEIGIELTGGSAVALVADDTAIFTVRKINLGYITSDIGVEKVGRYYKVVLSQQRQTGGTITMTTLYKCLILRGPGDNPDGENNTMQLTIKPNKDEDNSNKIGQIQWTVGVNS